MEIIDIYYLILLKQIIGIVSIVAISVSFIVYIFVITRRL